MIAGLGGVLVGALVLYLGAARLITGASALAGALGVSPTVVGLTVVAFGTSLPELVVSATAALRGNPDIALGNVVGSNIANVGLILGVSSLIRCLSVEVSLLRREVPLGFAAVALVVVLSLDGVLGRGDGLVLLAGFAGFLCWSVLVGRMPAGTAVAPPAGDTGSRLGAARSGLWVAVGLAAVVVGGNWLVQGGVVVAKALGVPAVIVGLTVVAVGTSLPELAASLAAVTRGEDEINMGTVLGSNLFNLLAVLGLAAVIEPLGVPGTFFRFQYPALIVFTLALLPICLTGPRISRAEGGLLLGSYAAYVGAVFWLPALR